eukprot:360467-Chlamydomonas_euryale.AAC.3
MGQGGGAGGGGADPLEPQDRWRRSRAPTLGPPVDQIAASPACLCPASPLRLTTGATVNKEGANQGSVCAGWGRGGTLKGCGGAHASKRGGPAPSRRGAHGGNRGDRRGRRRASARACGCSRRGAGTSRRRMRIATSTTRGLPPASGRRVARCVGEAARATRLHPAGGAHAHACAARAAARAGDASPATCGRRRPPRRVARPPGEAGSSEDEHAGNTQADREGSRERSRGDGADAAEDERAKGGWAGAAPAPLTGADRAAAHTRRADAWRWSPIWRAGTRVSAITDSTSKVAKCEERPAAWALRGRGQNPRHQNPNQSL